MSDYATCQALRGLELNRVEMLTVVGFPVGGGSMFVRFVVDEVDVDSRQPLGVFQAIARLARHGVLSLQDARQEKEIGEWFDKNLVKPARFTTSKPPYHNKQSKAISWWKDSAHSHISQVRLLVAILERHGVSVRMLTADRVGYVVYEDDPQIVAEPFAGKS